jgi:hypothetical protein
MLHAGKGEGERKRTVWSVWRQRRRPLGNIYETNWEEVRRRRRRAGVTWAWSSLSFVLLPRWQQFHHKLDPDRSILPPPCPLLLLLLLAPCWLEWFEIFLESRVWPTSREERRSDEGICGGEEGERGTGRRWVGREGDWLLHLWFLKDLSSFLVISIFSLTDLSLDLTHCLLVLDDLTVVSTTHELNKKGRKEGTDVRITVPLLSCRVT